MARPATSTLLAQLDALTARAEALRAAAGTSLTAGLFPLDRATLAAWQAQGTPLSRWCDVMNGTDPLAGRFQCPAGDLRALRERYETISKLPFRKVK